EAVDRGAAGQREHGHQRNGAAGRRGAIHVQALQEFSGCDAHGRAARNVRRLVSVEAHHKAASRRALSTAAWPTGVSGTMGRRTPALQRPRRDKAHFVGAGLGSQKSARCSDSSRRWIAVARFTSPSMAAAHISCISFGATLAVTLTLPWPPS